MHRQHLIHCSGRGHYRPGRPTLIITNHRRDTDGPLVATMLLARKGLRFTGPLPHFVAREDLMRPGFLRRYMTSWPDWIRTLVGWFSLARFVRAMNVHPMRRFSEQTLGEVLDDVYQTFGDLPLDEVLKPAWVARFRRMSPREDGPHRVREARSRRYWSVLESPYGLRRLNLSFFRRLKPYERQTVVAQIGEVAQQLQQGQPVHFVPEGAISPDGRSGRFREGTHRLLKAGGPDLAVLPLGILYDDVTLQQPRIFLVMGEELHGVRGRDRAESERELREALSARQVLTLSQVASALLLDRAAPERNVTAAELDCQVAGQAETLQALGSPLDPLLEESARRRDRLEGFLGFCLRYNLMVAEGGGYRLRPEGVGQPDPWSPAGRLRYAANEFAELAAFWGHPDFRSASPRGSRPGDSMTAIAPHA
ncbi:hypothetical protein [Thiohalorhabdus sp.]|uniref:hypothetical protein n=1 Tax=Thiohalorhabdus sp. TaxID=3094134 RepID=UPI002FC29672